MILNKVKSIISRTATTSITDYSKSLYILGVRVYKDSRYEDISDTSSEENSKLDADAKIQAKIDNDDLSNVIVEGFKSIDNVE